MLNSQLFDYLRKQYLYRHDDATLISLNGGDINRAFQLRAGNRNLFMKVNDAEKFPRMLEKESKGLHALRETGTIAVPGEIEHGVIGGEQFLILEWVSGKDHKKGQHAGAALARLHAIRQKAFGWHEDNYIGSLRQKNTIHKNGIGFFTDMRLKSLFYQAKEAGLFSAADEGYFESLCARLPGLLPDEKPALLHGDLWGGNFIHRHFIDPAVYCGNREADLAMTLLFGGFSEAFYKEYDEVYPLQPGWRSRAEIWNLYPLLVHVLLFGGTYTERVRAFVKKYS